MIDAPATPDVKHRLLLAAEEVFAEKGFKAATVREIVDKAQANIAAINYHFGDKEQLYIETCKFAHTCVSVPEPPRWTDATLPATKLADFIAIMVHNMTAPTRGTALQLMMRELANPTEAARQIVNDYIQPMAFTLRGILREMFPGAGEHRLLMLGFSVIGQCLYYRQNRPVSELIFGDGIMDHLTPDTIARHITRFTLAALGQAPPISSLEDLP